MSGGGSPSTTQTTQQHLPAWATPYARDILQQAGNIYFPGGQMLPASAAVANFSPDQLAAMQLTEQLSGVAPGTTASYLNWNPLADYYQAPPVNPLARQQPGAQAPVAATPASTPAQIINAGVPGGAGAGF